MLLSGCSCPNRYSPREDPPSLPVCLLPKTQPRIALVLGGGGAKGLAHVGVLEEFEKAGIPIDMIIGCSAGSIVGALYADCLDANYLRLILEPMKTNSLLDINIFKARYGLSQGTSLRKFLYEHLSVRYFDELKIPFIAVATDLYSGELVPIGGGPIVSAVVASSSIPLVFVPVEIHGRILVDGGVIDPVPVRIARNLGADFIVAVDLRGLLEDTFPVNLFGVAKRSAEITLLWQSESCLINADVVIKPHLDGIGMFDDKYRRTIYEAGRCAALEAIPVIKSYLESLPD